MKEDIDVDDNDDVNVNNNDDDDDSVNGVKAKVFIAKWNAK